MAIRFIRVAARCPLDGSIPRHCGAGERSTCGNGECTDPTSLLDGNTRALAPQESGVRAAPALPDGAKPPEPSPPHARWAARRSRTAPTPPWRRRRRWRRPGGSSGPGAGRQRDFPSRIGSCQHATGAGRTQQTRTTRTTHQQGTSRRGRGTGRSGRGCRPFTSAAAAARATGWRRSLK